MSSVLSQHKFRDKYEIIERISEGNFGTVYKAKEARSGDIVAIKKVITSKKNRKNTEREIEALAEF